MQHIADTMIRDSTQFQHGHQFDLFNAPDPAKIIPFGYYCSRAVSNEKLKPGPGGWLKHILNLGYFSDGLMASLRYEWIFEKLVLGNTIAAALGMGT